jgi:L-rhamnose mutarotase
MAQLLTIYYSLFIRKDGLMFVYFETPYSYKAASEAIATEEASIRWHDFMLPFFEKFEGRSFRWPGN